MNATTTFPLSYGSDSAAPAEAAGGGRSPNKQATPLKCGNASAGERRGVHFAEETATAEEEVADAHALGLGRHARGHHAAAHPVRIPDHDAAGVGLQDVALGDEREESGSQRRGHRPLVRSAAPRETTWMPESRGTCGRATDG